MTIALGILCSDGVVLGVDSEISVDGGKVAGPKIQVFWEALPDYNIVSASSGHADSVETARGEIEFELEKFRGKNPVVRELRQSISDALGRVYVQHIDPLPQEERQQMDFSLLLAIRIGRTARLFRTNRAQVVEQRPRWCIGSGKEFADYLLELYLGNRPPVELAAQTAAYVIGITKEHIDGVGHATDVHILQSSGRHWRLSPPEIEELEKNFDSFFKALHNVVACVDSLTVAEDGIDWRIELLKNSLGELRATQRKRLERSAKRLLNFEAGQSDPQQTTTDPSHQRPLQETPGGSGES